MKYCMEICTVLWKEINMNDFTNSDGGIGNDVIHIIGAGMVQKSLDTSS